MADDDIPDTELKSMADGFRHEALLYRDAREFADGTAAFVRRGLQAGEPVLVAVIEPRQSMLRAELGSDARHVEFLDMANVGRNPARIIPAWQAWVDRHAANGRGFRGIGEPIWAARTAAELVECQQHEQLLNVAFDDGPSWTLLCPYDTAGLPATVIARAHDTHPSLVAGAERLASSSYPHPELTHAAMFSAPLLEPVPDDDGVVFRRAFDRMDLADVRKLVFDFASPGLDDTAARELVLVVNELATNSVRHGGGRGVLRLWREGGHLVCEVRDRGLITDPLVGRRRPPGSVDGGAGLWIANQLCDLVQIRSAPGTGTTIRVRRRLGSQG